MSDEAGTPGPWDHVAVQLQAWRRDADDPSYAELAARISRQRERDGATPAAARLGRTTVYDAFRVGRTRLNRGLIREIGAALGVERDAVERLLDRPATTPSSTDLTEAPDPTPQATATDWQAWKPSALLMLAALLMNLIGREVVDFLGLPIYLDMTGTALAAVVLGPWRGALVGGSTNIIGGLLTGAVSLPFALVNVLGALIWGYGVHRFGMGRTLARFFALSLMVAVACSAVAVPILLMLFGGSIGHAQDNLTASMLELTHGFVIAVLSGNMLTSIADKLISGFVALVGASLVGVQIGTEPAQPLRFSQRVRRGATTA